MNTLSWRLAKNHLFTATVTLLSAALLLPLAAILFYIIKNGLSIISWDFITKLPSPMGETGGGVSNALVGSLLLVTIASVISIPVGIATGVFLSENPKGFIPNTARVCIDTLQGVPSIVIGIIAYLWIVKPLGHFSLLSGSIGLSIMMLPVIVKSTEETMKRIPSTLKEGALALGAPYYRTILKVMIPTGFNGITTGILLGISRVAGESAPLLFTAFGNPFMSVSLQKPVNALPLLIFNYATSPDELWQKYAWGASLLLLLFIFCLSFITKAVSKK